MDAADYLQFHLKVPEDQLERLAAALEDRVEASWWDTDSNRLSGMVAVDQRAPFEALLTELTHELGCGPVQLAFEPLKDRDWLRDEQRRLPPLPIGCFWLYFNAHARPEAPADAIPLFISDAGAFGSGHHITTHQCLLALEQMRGRPVRRMADIGCGSGILSLAAASLWKAEQVAVDIDPKSVLVARENLRANGANHVQTGVSNGFSHPLLNQKGPYDLIVANILTDIVIDLAPHVDRLLTPDGVVLLSGITTAYCPDVLSTYEQLGLHPQSQVDGNDWSTLLLSRRSGA